jgi:ribosomal protein S18 acetylase RimI-like enzyme
MVEPSFREARVEDCGSIAEAVAASSGGYAQLGWLERRGEFPGLSLIEIGARAYAEDAAPYTWRNATIAGAAGDTAGVLLTFGIDPGYESVEPGIRSDAGEDVYAPVRMEQPDSWYICAMTVFEPWRGKGIGTRMLELCRHQARSRRYPQLSLIAFEQNTGSVRLYERHGFTVIARSPIIPHSIIEYRGDALLMTAPV